MARDAAQAPNYTADNFSSAIPAMGQALLDYGLVAQHFKLAIGFGTPDSTVLLTLPAAKKFIILRAYWEVTSSFAGGTSSSIGISSNDTNYATAGDILGGAGGDVAATLVSTGNPYKGGTVGAKFASNGVVVLGAGKTVLFNRIVSIYTSGAGFLHLDGNFVD